MPTFTLVLLATVGVIGVFFPAPRPRRDGHTFQWWWAVFIFAMFWLGADWEQSGLHDGAGRIINAVVWAVFAYQWATFRAKTKALQAQ